MESQTAVTAALEAFQTAENTVQEKIKHLVTEIETFAGQTKEAVEDFRIKMLGKKGAIVELFAVVASHGLMRGIYISLQIF